MSRVASARVVMAGATGSALIAPARGSYAVSNLDRRLIVDRRGRRPGGNSAAVRGQASVLWSRSPADMERQILVRVDRAARIGEAELRYQLDRKDDHPLAREDELLDVLAELEQLGLVEAELCFRLTAAVRERLTQGDDGRGCERR